MSLGDVRLENFHPPTNGLGLIRVHLAFEIYIALSSHPLRGYWYLFGGEFLNFWLAPNPNKWVAPLGASPFAVGVFVSSRCSREQVECVIVKFREKMGGRLSSTEKILPTTSVCEMAVLRSFRGWQRKFWTENLASFGGAKGSRRGSSRSSLIGSQSQDLLLADGRVSSWYCPRFRRTY